MTAVSSRTTDPTVEEALRTAERTLEAHHEAYLEGLRDDVAAPLRDTLAAALDAHEEARSALPTGETTRRALWTSLRAYRHATQENVWRPVRTCLEETRPGERLRDRAEALERARGALSDEVPERLTRPEPDGLYAPTPGEGWGRRVGKAAVRAWRAVRGLASNSDVRPQTVPLAEILDRYAATALPEDEEEVLQSAEQRLVGWIARLEREAAAWTHRLLELERVLDCPALHENEVCPSEEADGPVDDPTSGVMAPDVDAVRAEVRERAEALHRCLRAGRDLDLDVLSDAFATVRETAIDRLRDAADRAGTFMAEPRSGPSRSARRAQGRRRRRRDRWPEWFDEATDRLALFDALASLRDDLVDRLRALVDDVIEAGVAPGRSVGVETTERLAELRDDFDALLRPPAPGEELDLLQAVDHQVETGIDRVEDMLLEPLRTHAPRRAAQTVMDAHWEAVASLLDAQPEGFVVHPVAASSEGPVEPGEAYTVQWRAGCREVLDELLFDAWRAALDSLLGTVEPLPSRAAEVQSIVEFNLGAALQELQDLREARRDGSDDETPFVDRARELALGGLDRATDLLEAERDTLARAAGTLRRDVWRATTEGWTDLHDRVRAAGQTRAHMLRVRGELVRGARWLAVETGRRVRATTVQLRRTLHRAQRQARRLVRLGQAAVGTTSVDEAALQQTVETLSTVDAVLADLPLVYRRLFSFRPLQSPDLLVARDGDRAAVERHATRWEEGLTSPLVLTGPAGSGRTSLLNVLRKTTFRTARRHAIELDDRIATEAEFVARVIRALDLALDPRDTTTLDAVAEHLRTQPVPERVRVCTIEQFEHVFRRTVGGTALGARILNFLSETDARVLWIVTTTETTWQFVEASEPAASRLVTRHRLDPLDRQELETLIMTRHQRSGLRLAFEVPDESAYPILARRLRALDDEERRQALLREEFFDRLYDVCGQNVMLALFYWFRSVRLDAETNTLRVRPLDPISFEVLDTLPLPYAFALKALLEHGTLTVDELAEVMGETPATSRSRLETLGNALLIAPADRVEGPGVFRFASVDRETRYRIRPLLLHPVTRFLRSRNILH